MQSPYNSAVQFKAPQFSVEPRQTLLCVLLIAELIVTYIPPQISNARLNVANQMRHFRGCRHDIALRAWPPRSG